MKTYTNGTFKIGLIPTTFILAGITLAFILFVTQSQQSQMATQVAPTPTAQSTSAIKNTTDLDAAAKQLDSVDPKALDQNINAVTTDNSAI